jgi:hypothetical protein
LRKTIPAFGWLTPTEITLNLDLFWALPLDFSAALQVEHDLTYR